MSPTPGPARRSTAIVVISIALGVALAAPATAQLRAGSAAHTLLRPAGLLAAEPAYAGATLGTRSTEPAGGPTAAARATPLEGAPDPGTGHLTRPRLLAGLPSDALKLRMTSAGLATDTCLLPAPQARPRTASDAEMYDSMGLIAPCTSR